MTELLIPFAAPPAEAGRDALSGLALPHLSALLATLAPTARDDGSAVSLSPPHERALAAVFGWSGADGCLPWAAHAAVGDGIDPGDRAWGLVTPAHWHVGTDQVGLVDPAELQLDAGASRAFCDAVEPLVADAGWTLHWGAPLRWYAAHDGFAQLPCASPDRAIGRNVDVWLGADPALRAVRRLQSEVQMWLHGHPLNAAREAQGLAAVNSFWLSGCGVAQPVRRAAPSVDDTLRAPALAGDWGAWTQAWQRLDAGAVAGLLDAARRGVAVTLTLAGERAWAAWSGAATGWRARWRRATAWRVDACTVLAGL